MATAATMHATHIRPGHVPIAPSPSARSRPSSSTSQQNRNKNASAGDSGRNLTTPQTPCDGCKRRNSRCAFNERAGKCYSCEFHRQECLFTQPRQRKRSYDEAVEGLQALTNARSKPRHSPTKAKKMAATPNPQSQSTSAPSIAVYQPPVREEDRACRYIGGTTDSELFLLERLPSQSLPSLRNGTRVERYDDKTFMEISHDGPRDAHFAAIERIDSLVNPENELLVAFFLDTVQPSFPVLSEHDITCLKSSRAALDPALLAAVYLLALVSKGPSPPDLVASLEDLSANLLQESLLQPRLSSVQAALIMSQIWSISSPLLNMQINAAAFDLGLHQDCSAWNISQSHKSLRKRLAWAFYAHDKWTALSTGRPSLINAANWTVQPLTIADFEPTSSPVPTVELFTSYITLSTLLSSVLDTFYTLSSATLSSPQHILGLAKPVQLQLKEWYSNLPTCLKMDHAVTTAASGTSSPIPEAHSSRPLAFLHLAYFTTEILLHRRIIRSLSSSPTYTPLHHICRLAAKTRLISSLDFCNRLRHTHFGAFWPVGSRIQFAMVGGFGTLLLATSPTVEEEEFYLARLQEFRWTLGVCAAACPGGEDRLGFPEALYKLGLGLELWERGKEANGVTNKSVRDVAEEMKRTQIADMKSMRERQAAVMRTAEAEQDDDDMEGDFDESDE